MKDITTEKEKLARAQLCLQTTAYADALGMPTQDLTRQSIEAEYGFVDTLVAAGPAQEIAHGAPAGMVTDDTEQTFMLAKILIEHGAVPPLEFAHGLLEWEKDMIARGSLDLLGPSTKRAISALEDGVPPSETGKYGTTNGAAMRISPVGIAFDLSDRQRFMAAVVQASQVTHNTNVALQGAMLVAGAVSAGIAGASRQEALEIGLDLAREAATFGNQVCAPDIYLRSRWAIQLLKKCTSREEILDTLFNQICTSCASHESIPAVAALCALDVSANEVLLLAANAGGDTDTVGAMAGAILGACGDSAKIPPESLELVTTLNSLPIVQTAANLVSLRISKEK